MSPYASGRDLIEASGDLSRSVMNGNVWGGLGALGHMGLATFGMIPGMRPVTKGVKAALDEAAKLEARQMSKVGPIALGQPEQIRRALGITEEIPEHARYYGAHIGEMRRRIESGEITVRDWIKANAATTSSIRREAKKLASTTRDRLGIPANVNEVRSEEALAFWMKTPDGQSYLNMAQIRNRTPEQEKVLQDSVKNAGELLRPFGRQNALEKDLLDAASEKIHASYDEALKLVKNKDTTAEQWREFASKLPGVGTGKAGWLGEHMGFGKAATIDSRASRLIDEHPYLRQYLARTRPDDVGGELAELYKNIMPWLAEKYGDDATAVAHEVIFSLMGKAPKLTKESLEHWRSAALGRERGPAIVPGSLGPLDLIQTGVA